MYSLPAKRDCQNYGLRIYGWLLEDKLLWLPDEQILLSRIGISPHEIYLRNTMANLMTFLLSHAEQDFITDNEILLHVWELNGLQGSTSRLREVARILKKILLKAGLSEGIFHRADRKGYLVNHQRVLTLYCEIPKHIPVLEMQIERLKGI